MRIILLLLLLCPYMSMGQQVKTLNIGDQLPVKAFRLSNGESCRIAARALTLIAFFDTRCTGCIASMRNAKALQLDMANALNIIPVTRQADQDAKMFFTKHSTIALPYIAEDSMLCRFFQYASVPHWVWLDARGVVRAITSGSYVTKENITALLEGKKPELPVKKDELDYVREKPLLVDGNGGKQDAFLYRSLITPYLDGVPGGMGWRPDKTANTTRVIATNMSIVSLYALAYNEILINRNQVVLQTIDAARVSYHPSLGNKRAWEQHNLYCYELIFPSADRQKVQPIVLQDLDRFFNTTSTYEKKPVKCLLLKKVTTTSFASNEPEGEVQINEDSIVLKKQPAYSLVKEMNKIADMPPVIDATNDKGDLDMVLHCSITNLDALQAELKRYGLMLEPSEKTMPIITITGKNN